MTIKAPPSLVEETGRERQVKRRVEEVLPPGVSVTVREEPMRHTLFVELAESRQRRVLRWLRLESMSRAGVLARVSCELADSPAGVAVTTRWR